MPARVLWVTDEVPDAGRGGGSIRQYHLLKRVAERVEVDLLLAGELSDPDLRAGLRQIRTFPRPTDHMSLWGTGRLGTARRRVHNLATVLPGATPSEVVINRRISDSLKDLIGDTSAYDLVQVEHEHLAGVLPRHKTTRWAMTLHNLLSVRSRQRASVSAKPRVQRLWEADARRADAWERRIVENFDLTVVVSDEDAAALGRAVVVPNGVDLERFGSTPLPTDHRMIFSGSFNYEPNIDAAAWLCQEILPVVRTDLPDATLLLVGREPDDRVRQLARLPGVQAEFDVPDVRPLLRSARIAIVPLRQGSGTRLKALEAMAAGRPIVGTTIGLEGLHLEHGVSALIGDTPDDLARATIALMTDHEAASKQAAAARSIAESHFGWDSLAELYLDAVLGPSSESHGPQTLGKRQ